MIDCLSNPSWINPQIDFLIFLQNIRLGCPDYIDKFFLSITVFGEFWLPTLICAIAYWCIDFRVGLYLFTLESFNVFLTHLFKMLACVYRPWILDSRMQPSALAVPFAKGYSFPSGHSAMSSSILGGVAYLIRRKRVLCALLICLVLLIGFSRLWLGVHTPQDVVCGLTLGLILIFGVNQIINWAEENKNRYWYLMTIVNIFALISLIYILFFNTYRMDYLSGELLVNPMKAKYFSATVYGYSFGIINGCFLCRMFCPFNPKDVSIKRRILRGLLGALGFILLSKFVFTYIVMNTVALKPALLIMFLIGICITLIYPLIFTKCKRL